MAGYALGLIETVGLTAAIEAADTALKSADVMLVGYEMARGGGLVTVKFLGEVSAVQAAVESGCAAASKVHKVKSNLVIARPHEDLEQMIRTIDNKGKRKTAEGAHIDEKTTPVETAAQEVAEAVRATKAADISSEVQAEAEDEESVRESEAEPKLPEDGAAIEKREPEAVTEQMDTTIEGGYTKDELPTPKEQAAGTDVSATVSDGEAKHRTAGEEEKTDSVCNLCHDPACPRRKGGPRSACLHYKKKK